jgi:hypothetical protein
MVLSVANFFSTAVTASTSAGLLKSALPAAIDTDASAAALITAAQKSDFVQVRMSDNPPMNRISGCREQRSTMSDQW